MLQSSCLSCLSKQHLSFPGRLAKQDQHEVGSEMQIITSTAKAHGCSAEIDWMEEAHPYYPPTINNPDLAAFVKDVGARLVTASLHAGL